MSTRARPGINAWIVLACVISLMVGSPPAAAGESASWHPTAATESGPSTCGSVEMLVDTTQRATCLDQTLRVQNFPAVDSTFRRAAAAQSSRDTTIRRGPWLNLRPYPLATWGPRVGVGGGLGLVVNRVTSRDDEFLLTVAPAVHEQVYTVSYTSDADREARQYLLVHGRHAFTDRDWFYGFGPASSPDARTSFSLRTFQGGIRWGHRLLDHTLMVQGHGRMEHYRIYSARRPEPNPDDPALTDARSYAGAISDGRSDSRSTGAVYSTSGAVLGIDLAYDRRNRRAFTTGGLLLQSTLESWIPLGEDGLSYWRSDLGAYGWIPLGQRHRFALRAHLSQMISSDGDLGVPPGGTSSGPSDLPHFLLPVLGGHTAPGLPRRRYVGNDALIVGLAYEFPIYTGFGFTLEGHAGTHLASVYDDIWSQFELAVDGSETLRPSREQYPLRPTFSTGLRFGPVFRDQSYVDVAVGRGPEGWTLVRFSFTRSLSRARPPHHESNHWRR